MSYFFLKLFLKQITFFIYFYLSTTASSDQNIMKLLWAKDTSKLCLDDDMVEYSLPDPLGM